MLLVLVSSVSVEGRLTPSWQTHGHDGRVGSEGVKHLVSFVRLLVSHDVSLQQAQCLQRLLTLTVVKMIKYNNLLHNLQKNNE